MMTPSFYPIKGGTETVVRNLAILLNKRGVHTSVMTFNTNRKWSPKWQGKTEIIDGITVFKIPALKWIPSARFTLGINNIPGRFRHISKNYDIMHFHELELSFPFFSFTARKPKIFHFHGFDIEFLKRYYLHKFLLKHLADYYISISKKMKRDLLETGFPVSRVIYLPNGVDTEFFRHMGEKEENLLLFVGRITAVKGLHILFKALRYLRIPVRLAVVGPAAWDRDYYLDMLDLMKMENQKAKHEIMYLGALDQVEIVKWYRKASIFILPSFREGFPITVLEALSCETPVIATPVGGVPEVVENHKNGILVPQNDPIKLAKAIEFLLENRNIRTGFGLRGRKIVVKEFSFKVVVPKLCTIYERILNS